MVYVQSTPSMNRRRRGSHAPRLFQLVQQLHLSRGILTGVEVRVVGLGETAVKLLEDDRLGFAVGTG